jgi:hypothetical protein
MVGQDGESILSAATACKMAFDQCSVGADHDREEIKHAITDFLDTECGRFRLWADRERVFKSGAGSLDHILQNEPTIRDLILAQLHIIAKYLSPSKGQKIIEALGLKAYTL